MNGDDGLAAQRREHPEPHEAGRPVPRSVLALAAGLVVFGVVYILGADVDTPSTWGDARVRDELAAGRRAPDGARVDAAALYASHCAACHQATGRGLPGVFPPLAGSEWVGGKPSTLAAIVLHGVTGEITVAGATYRGAMPAFHGQFSDAQVAALLTHLRSQWGNTADPVDAATVAAARTAHADRTTPFDGGRELQSLP